MSDPLRIALVAEGPTDRIVVEAALRAILGARLFVLTQLQPEGSLVFGQLGGGWSGVYRWCKQAAARGGGHLADDALLFGNFDILCLHLDADVAGKCYAHASIVPDGCDGALPCEHPCPPATATTNVLRQALLSWCGESTIPARTVICMPSKSTEAWVVAALYPNDTAMAQGIECLADPESRLAQQPKAVRIRKRQVHYRDREASITNAWEKIAVQTICGEALRFADDVRTLLAAG